MKYWTLQPLSLAVNPQANYRFRPSAAFDIDPALGGTSMPGFAELSQQYSMYRVYGSSIKVTASNPSTTIPVSLIVCPLNQDPSNAMTAANVIASSGQPYAKMKVMPLLGGPATRISSYMTTVRIFGDPAVNYDHNFSSLVSTVPANNWFWNIAVYSGATIATNITVNFEIEVDCEFFDRFFLPI
jgi:hypothetical protein